jgi:hypothetical protein
MEPCAWVQTPDLVFDYYYYYFKDRVQYTLGPPASLYLPSAGILACTTMPSVCISRDWTTGSMLGRHSRHVVPLFWVQSMCHHLFWCHGLTSQLQQNSYILGLFFSGFRSASLQKATLCIPSLPCQLPAPDRMYLTWYCQLIWRKALPPANFKCLPQSQQGWKYSKQNTPPRANWD